MPGVSAVSWQDGVRGYIVHDDLGSFSATDMRIMCARRESHGAIEQTRHDSYVEGIGVLDSR
jgi:hypothetical protein